MPNSLSAKKRLRQNETRRLRRRSQRSAARTAVRRVVEAVESGNRDLADSEFRNAQKALAQAASDGVFHKNTAARQVSRLNSLLRRSFAENQFATSPEIDVPSLHMRVDERSNDFARTGVLQRYIDVQSPQKTDSCMQVRVKIDTVLGQLITHQSLVFDNFGGIAGSILKLKERFSNALLYLLVPKPRRERTTFRVEAAILDATPQDSPARLLQDANFARFDLSDYPAEWEQAKVKTPVGAFLILEASIGDVRVAKLTDNALEVYGVLNLSDDTSDIAGKIVSSFFPHPEISQCVRNCVDEMHNDLLKMYVNYSDVASMSSDTPACAKNP